MLDVKKIKEFLEKKTVDIKIFEEIDSTNEYLKSCTLEGNHPLICIAEMQTHGKGRLGRQWHSPFGQNIYLSILYPFCKKTKDLSGLSLVVALAICKTIEKTCELSQPLFVKWPNDVIIDQKKIAGNLIEIQTTSSTFSNVIIGIGINVNMQAVSESNINQPWTSIQQLTGKTLDRNLLCAKLIDQIIHDFKIFEVYEFKKFITEWNKHDWLLGKTIQLVSNECKFTGTGNGINEDGHLLLTMPDNSQKAFTSGDTHLLK